MKYARVEVKKSVFDAREKSVELETIFGSVYAPKSAIVVERERKTEMETNTIVQMLVPCWVFWKAHFNPCQLVTGFIELIDR